jgi:hypothetical protein
MPTYMPIPGNGLHGRCTRQTIPGNPPTKRIYKDQPSWAISVSNCIYETYDLGEALILGGGFRTFAGTLAVSNGRTTVSKTVALCTIRLSLIWNNNIRQNRL